MSEVEKLTAAGRQAAAAACGHAWCGGHCPSPRRRAFGVVEPAYDVLQQILRLLGALGAAPLIGHCQLQRRPAREYKVGSFLKHGSVLGRQLHPARAAAHKEPVAQDHALARHYSTVVLVEDCLN